MNLGLRLRVTLWSTAANGLALTLGVAILFWIVDGQLTGALDEGLAAQARTTAQAVEVWIANERLGSGGIEELLASDKLKVGLKNLFTTAKDVPAALPTMVSLLDSRGAMILATHSPNAVDVPAAEILKQVRDGVVHRAVTTMTDADDQENSYRVATVPVHARGQVEAFVQVLTPLASLRQTISQIQSLLAFSALALILINAWLVSLALGRALRPVDLLVDDIHRITERNLSVRVPVSGANDELHRLAKTFNAMLDRLDRGFQFQTRLFQDLSHQLKTPLAILTGTLEIALVKGRTAEEYRTILEDNLDEVGRMTQLIENLLLLARLDSQQLRLATRRVDLREFCQRWAQDFSLLWEAKDLTVRWEGLTSALSVDVDPDRLGQALLNLLDNAVKYSPPGGVLVFRFGEDGNWAFVELVNQGPPLAPGCEETIFQRFTKQTDGQPGFGLGLPIARAAVELHGGALTAFRPAGGGAGFRIELPYKGLIPG